MTDQVVIHRDDSGRWFSVDDVIYGVTYNGPRWGWSIHTFSGAVLADGYDTLRELRADARRAVRAASDQKQASSDG